MRDGHSSRWRSGSGWRRARRTLAVLGSVSAAGAFVATAGTASAVPATAPVGAAGIVPQGTARAGIMPSSATLHFDVVLAPRNPAALTKFANEVSTPGSELYRHYITAAQFPKMFGPTSATISSVYAALRARGLNPGVIASDHLSIPVTATAGQVDSAFGARMASYRLPGGRVGYANSSALELPANVAGDIQAVIGLDNLNLQHPLMTAPSPASGAKAARSKTAIPAAPAAGPKACAASLNAQATFHSNTGFNSYNYSQLAFAYEFSGIYSSHDFGRGENIGIVEFGEPNSKSDIATFQKCYGTKAKVSYVHVDGFHQTGPGQGEAALDIETVIAVAPVANVIVYQAPNNGVAPYDIYKKIIDSNKVKVISESYGLCEHYQDRRAVKAVTTLYKKAAAQGQTIVASSGDSGSESCLPNDGNPNRLSANFPASDPYVLGVGGTRITNLVRRPGEVVWNDGDDGNGAGGGGKSVIFGEPKYQTSFNIHSGKVREVPDVSADADPESGYMVFHQGAWANIGGTSAAAPLWAGFLTLTDAKCPRFPVGWSNSAIYFAASPHVKAVVINDIQAFPMQFPDQVNNNFTHFSPGNLYPVNVGYDAATGLGSPVGAVLATTLCKLDHKK